MNEKEINLNEIIDRIEEFFNKGAPTLTQNPVNRYEEFCKNDTAQSINLSQIQTIRGLNRRVSPDCARTINYAHLTPSPATLAEKFCKDDTTQDQKSRLTQIIGTITRDRARVIDYALEFKVTFE